MWKNLERMATRRWEKKFDNTVIAISTQCTDRRTDWRTDRGTDVLWRHSPRTAWPRYTYHRAVKWYKMVIVTMEYQYELNYEKDAISNDVEWPLIQISRSCHYITLNISETVQDRHRYNGMLIGTYTCPTHGCHFRWSCVHLSDSEIFNDRKQRAASPRQLSFLYNWSSAGCHVTSTVVVLNHLLHSLTWFNRL